MPRSGAQGSGHPSLALSAKLNCQGEFRRTEYGSGWQFAVMPLLPGAPACLPKSPATQQPPPHPAAWPAGFQHRTHTRFLFLLKKHAGVPPGFQKGFFPQHTLPLLALICVLCQRTVSTETPNPQPFLQQKWGHAAPARVQHTSMDLSPRGRGRYVDFSTSAAGTILVQMRSPQKLSVLSVSLKYTWLANTSQ